jgi:WD40 repeat protein
MKPVIFGSQDGVILDMEVIEEKSLVIANLANKIEVWNYQSKTLVRSWSCSQIISIDRYNGRLAGVSKSGNLVVWDIAAGQELLQVNISSDPLISVTWIGTEFLATGSDKGEILKINSTSGEVVSRIGTRHAITAIESLNDSLLISGNDKGEISAYHAKDLQFWKSSQGHKNWIREIKANESGTFFLSSSDDGSYRVWHVGKTLEPIVTNHPGNWLLCADFSGFAFNDKGIKAIGKRNGEILVYTAFGRYRAKLHSLINCITILTNKLPVISVLVGTHGEGIHLLKGTDMKLKTY